MWINIFKNIFFGLTLSGFFLLTSCTVGPDYLTPELSPPSAFIGGQNVDASSVVLTENLGKWWELLGDDILNDLIETAVGANHDIQIAQARLQESREGRTIATADFLPSVTANGTGATQYQSKNSPSYAGGDRETDLFRAGFDASWEIDIFGGVRRSVKAAEAREHAAEASLDDVVRIILAEVALNYVELRGFQQRKEVYLKNIDVQQRTFAFTRNRLISGLGTELDVSQTKAQLLSSKAVLPGIEKSIRLRILQICTLIGARPEQRYNQLLTYRSLPQIPEKIFTTTPSNVLRQRPDIQLAERLLAAEVADIGVATAELFPHFSIFGGIGGESDSATNLLDSNSMFWSIGPSIHWSLFQGGKVNADIKIQEAQADAALARYEKTILNVLQEVNSALVEHGYERHTARSLQMAKNESKTSVVLSTTLYKEGLTDILTVLNTELLLLQLEDEYSFSLTREWTSLIRLYKALGGGWEISSEKVNSQVGNDSVTKITYEG
ncbi:MAG: efflux transporter outer membrane subunit [Desulfotalea sp.]